MKRELVQVADNSVQSSFCLMKRLAVFVVVTMLTIPLAAQTAPAGGSNDAWSPAKSIGMFAYPTKNQNADQQLKDESQCYGSAKQNTGVDPQVPAPATPSAESQQAAQQNAAKQAGKDVQKGGTVKGAAGGAAGGAAIGAIAGDAGKGAAIGATAGAVAGRRAQKKGEKAAQQQAA
jgi:hypothetical protein